MEKPILEEPVLMNLEKDSKITLAIFVVLVFIINYVFFSFNAVLAVIVLDIIFLFLIWRVYMQKQGSGVRLMAFQKGERVPSAIVLSIEPAFDRPLFKPVNALNILRFLDTPSLWLSKENMQSISLKPENAEKVNFKDRIAEMRFTFYSNTEKNISIVTKKVFFESYFSFPSYETAEFLVGIKNPEEILLQLKKLGFPVK